MRRRSPEREAVIAKAREWRAARDRARISGWSIARLVGLSVERVNAILCAQVTPNEVEAWSLDEVLVRGVHGAARVEDDVRHASALLTPGDVAPDDPLAPVFARGDETVRDMLGRPEDYVDDLAELTAELRRLDEIIAAGG